MRKILILVLCGFMVMGGLSALASVSPAGHVQKTTTSTDSSPGTSENYLTASSPSPNVITQISPNATADMLSFWGNPTYTSPTGIRHAFILSSPIAPAPGGHYYDWAYSEAGITIASWNGTIDMRVGGELVFVPGADASNYGSLGTAWANLTYGNTTLSWHHVFDSVYVSGNLFWSSIAPEWNATAPLYVHAVLNVTLTADPGNPWRYSSNAPFLLGSHAVPIGGNSMDVTEFNGTPLFSPIPISKGYESLSYGQPVVSLQAGFDAAFPGENSSYVTEWKFSDGSTASGVDVNETFTNAGVYQISVNVSFGSAWDVHYFNVSVNIYVSVSDTVSSGFTPLQVDFFSSALGSSSYSYDWNFHNGQTSISQSPTETFSQGNYTVNLTVTDPGGAKGYADILIQSLPAPVTLEYSPQANVTVLTQVEFFATTAWYAQNASIVWNMPNGNRFSSFEFNYTFPSYSATNDITAGFSYDFNGSQSYQANLVVRMVPSLPVIQVTGYRSSILVNSSLTLDASRSFSYDASIQDYRWTYDNITYGQSSQTFTFHHSGKQEIKLEVIDSLGAETTETLTIRVLTPTASNGIFLAVSESNTSSSITFNVTATSNYQVQDVEAVLTGPIASGQTYFLNYVGGSGNRTEWSLSLNEYNFSSGTYSLEFVAFANDSSNYTTADFSLSPSLQGGGPGGFAGLGYLVTAVGGPTAFLTLMGVLISAITVIVALRSRGTQVVNIGGDEYESKPGGDLKRIKQGKVK